MTRRRKLVAVAAIGLTLAAAIAAWAICRAPDVSGACDVGRLAKIYPDCADVTVPPNIAPLNFQIQEPADKYHVAISSGLDSDSAGRIQIDCRDVDIRIPAKAWHELLGKHQGNSIAVDVYTRIGQGWKRFTRFQIHVAPEPIDSYAFYRLIPPLFKSHRQMALYQRDLRDFDERVMLDNETSLDSSGNSPAEGCVNCHTFLNHRTDKMLLHVRPSAMSSWQPAMLLVQDGKAKRVETRIGKQRGAGYTSWHPSGELLAFSRNILRQYFHADSPETREVVDDDSDLGLYVVATGQVVTDPKISRPDRLETFPTWSPDGKWLYFCSTAMWNPSKEARPDKSFHVRYDLMRIEFDLASRHFGRLETVVSSDQMGKSITEPRISPDGRFLMFCAHEYGSFPLYQNDSDLYMVDLSKLAGQQAASAPTTGPAPDSSPTPLAVADAAPVRLSLNSDRSESYHSWSSNSRWVIFSSKREDGLFVRLYICHIDEQGRCGKPFILPQKDPNFYSRFLMTYNVPELAIEPVTVTQAELVNAINAPSTMPAGNYAPASKL